MPIVFVVLEAFPHELVGPELTPHLWRLIEEGERVVDGGVAEMPSVSSTNHATFMTGCSGVEHGLVGDLVPLDGEWIPAGEVGPEVPTLFDACRAEGRRSAAVLGDPNLLGVCGAEAADVRWAPASPDPTGLAWVGSDAGVVAKLGELDLASLDFVLVQLNDVDDVRRRFSSADDKVRNQCRATDAMLGRIVAQLQPIWGETVLVVVGSHDYEDVGPLPPIDLNLVMPYDVMVANQGGVAVVVGPMGPSDLLGVRGVADYMSLDADHHVVWGRPGQFFGVGPVSAKGQHGSPRTATQLAVIGGGSPRVVDLVGRLGGGRPAAWVWAGWLAEAIGLKWRPETRNS